MGARSEMGQKKLKKGNIICFSFKPVINEDDKEKGEYPSQEVPLIMRFENISCY